MPFANGDKMTRNIIEIIDGLKRELDALRPLSPDVVARVAQKVRLEFNYHSNAIEGNALTLGETRNLILHGLTAHGKPMRDHLDIEGHNDAVKAMEEAVRRKEALNGVFIRNLHSVLLKEPYEMDALTEDGRLTKRLITVGQYKTAPNNVRTSTGETHYYTPPEQVGSEMTDLIDWYRDREGRGEHPIVVAATFHYRFVRIHPFDDGNGRMARLLMNMILIRHGYTVAVVKKENRDQYIREIEEVAKTESVTEFIAFIASCCEYTLRLHLRAARGESIEDPSDIDREIAIFKSSMLGQSKPRVAMDGRRYVEKVVLPLRKYCNDKLDALASDVFVEAMEYYANVKGVDGDGVAFSSGPGLSEESSIPNEVGRMRVTMEFALTGFVVTGEGVEIRIENQCDENGSAWTFDSDKWCDQIYKREYAGDDLAELKREVNDLLRWIMELAGRATTRGIPQ